MSRSIIQQYFARGKSRRGREREQPWYRLADNIKRWIDLS